MADQDSDFSARLKAMREGRQQAPAQMPSLKDRLQPNAAKDQRAANAPAKPDLKAKIHSKFSQKLSPSAAAPGAVSSALEENLPEFEQRSLPEQKEKKDPRTETWTPENGGVCPACSVFNPAHVAFCGHCRNMLLRSEVVVEVVTAYPITEIRGLVNAFVEKLIKLNIRTTEDMLRIGISHKNRQTLMKHTGLSERSLMRLIQHSDMCRIPSMTPEQTAMLELLGINSLSDLLKFKPLELYNKIQQNKIKLNQNHIVFLPTKNQVSIWLEEGKELVPLKLY